jgi:bifunctional non-homologous end joining protein LigD
MINKVEITHPDKIFWPKEKYTKKDLFGYYRDMASFIMPYLKDRPQSLKRCPDGIDGECFFQKDIDYDLPDWLETVKIHAESRNKDIHYLVCKNIDSLLYMVNLGCIEINPWNSRTVKIDYPDYAILDLDPLDVKFDIVVEAAVAIKNVLDEFSINCFCKTSGATGLHIYLPLGAKYTYDQVLDFTKIIANIVHSKIPGITSIERLPYKREKKVYIDCYQNRIGQTLAAPYCIRPRESAPVSTPLSWEELNKKLSPADFTIKNIFKRLDRIGDLWKGVLGKGINIEKCIDKISVKYDLNSFHNPDN